MARRIQSSRLATRSARLKLAPKGKPYWERINEGLSIGYRRNATGSGSWSMRAADGRGSSWIKVIAPADDYENTPGALTFGKRSVAPSSFTRARPPTTTAGSQPSPKPSPPIAGIWLRAAANLPTPTGSPTAFRLRSAA
jgi:hypothetical protein